MSVTLDSERLRLPTERYFKPTVYVRPVVQYWSPEYDYLYTHHAHYFAKEYTDVTTDSKSESPELEALNILKREVEIRKLTAEADRHEIEARRSARDEEAWNASADEHKIYHFFGGTDSSNCIAAMDIIGNWSRRGGDQDFTIVFNSPGGSVIHGLALYDFLEEVKNKGTRITTVARGMAASMGGILLQSGNERVVGKNAHVLIHELSTLGIGKLSEIEDEIKFAKRLQERALDILASRSTLSKKQIETRWKRKDWWLDANECVEYGFADRVG